MKKRFMQKIKRYIITTFTLLCLSMLLTGCSDVVWFETKDKGGIKAVSDDELAQDTFYVKQGTKFYKTLAVEEGNARNETKIIKSDRIIPVVNDQMIPNHYLHELLAFTSTKQIVSDVSLERFKDLGYSIGIYGAYIDENGMFTANKTRNVAKNSTFEKAIKEETAQEFRVVSIDGKALEKSDIDYSAGMIKGLEKDKTYHVGYYAGTYYREADLVADTLILQSYEIFFYDNSYIDYTTNGYLCFKTPDDLKCGYYYVNGSGIFRYFDHDKGQSDDVDMNVSYYESEQARIAAYSRQYSMDIDTKVKDAAINIYYNEPNGNLSEEDIAGFVYAPNGTQYEMIRDDKENTLSLTLTEVAIGEWTINVMPKDLDVYDVKFESTKVGEDATLSEKTFTYDEDTTNIVFSCDIKGDGDVFGYVVTESGRTYDMILDFDNKEKTGRLYYELAYVGQGSYNIKVYYHPAITEISEITAKENVSTETDIIYVGD